MLRAVALLVLLAGSPAHAEQWTGETVALRALERGVICQAGPLQISLDGGSIEAVLTKFKLDLKGTMKADGTIEMAARQGARIYTFTGKKADALMRGAWIDAGSGCGGTWRARPAEPGDG
jgi:hypothetical protein